MSWLKKSSDAMRRKEQEENAARMAAQKELQKRIDAWSIVTRPAHTAISEWNKFELSKMLVDVNNSGILSKRCQLSQFFCVFSHDVSFEYASQRKAWFGRKFSWNGYSNLNQGLELETGNQERVTYANPKDYSFSHVRQYLFEERHEGDGDTWGYFYKVIMLSFCLFENSLSIKYLDQDDITYNLSQSTRSKRYVEGLIDSFLASKIAGSRQ